MISLGATKSNGFPPDAVIGSYVYNTDDEKVYIKGEDGWIEISTELRDVITLEEGEMICDDCNGESVTGRFHCEKCQDTGKVDWVENIFGKKSQQEDWFGSGYTGYGGSFGMSGVSGHSGISGYTGISGYVGLSGSSGYATISGSSYSNPLPGYSGVTTYTQPNPNSYNQIQFHHRNQQLNTQQNQYNSNQYVSPPIIPITSKIFTSTESKVRCFVDILFFGIIAGTIILSLL